jgi:hypothetical protein
VSHDKKLDSRPLHCLEVRLSVWLTWAKGISSDFLLEIAFAFTFGLLDY